MAKVELRLARPEDDAAIAELMARVVMPGSLRISCRYQGSFFGALECEGQSPRVLVGESAGRVVGVGSVTTRELCLDGEPASVGYLASLRLAPEVRESSLLARGYRLLGEVHRELGLSFSLTSIMRENARALSVLTSGKGGLPSYRFLAGYKTAVIPALRRYRTAGDLRVVPGGEGGLDAVFDCFARFGRGKDFFPAYRRGEVAGGRGILKGLALDDFLVAFRGSEPVGCVALWDQSSFKKLVVEEYGGGMRLAALADRALGIVTGAPVLPAAGVPFAPLYLSCVAVRDDDPALLRAILAVALNRMREGGRRLLIAGFFEEDRLCGALDAFFHVPMYSNIYQVSWEGDAPRVGTTGRAPYLDVGSL